MSSPPNTGGSPPYTPHLSVPRKRPSINTSLSASSSNFKRHKPASSTGSSAHPLRQTSFPPPEQAVVSPSSPSFSPPADGSVTGRSSTVGTGKRKRGRPRASDARSATGGSGRASKANSTSGRASAADGHGEGAREDEEPEDDDMEMGVDTVLEGSGVTDEAQLKVERQNMRMLIEAFSNDQADRYDMWRRVRLDKATLRRLVNHTLSQSVPPSVITTINGYTKLFIGELIERARDVQDEWLAASPTLPTGELKPYLQKAAAATSQTSASTATKTTASAQSSSDTLPSPPANSTSDINGIKPDPERMEEDEQTSFSDAKQPSQGSSKTQEAQEAAERFTVEERDRGPLTADHLREALRRYRKDREGGSAGFQGLSMEGKAHVASRVGGRRLFR